MVIDYFLTAYNLWLYRRIGLKSTEHLTLLPIDSSLGVRMKFGIVTYRISGTRQRKQTNHQGRARLPACYHFKNICSLFHEYCQFIYFSISISIIELQYTLRFALYFLVPHIFDNSHITFSLENCSINCV